MKSLLNVLVLLALITFIGCDASKKTTDAVSSTANDVVEAVETAVEYTNAPGAITFAAANERYSANGSFATWNFTNIDMDGGIESLNADLKIDLASISEKSEKLANHLKQADYFHVEKYTTATANISNVRESGDGYVADMTLSMRDAEQVIEAPFELVSEKPLRVRGTVDVDRSIFKIGTDETGNYKPFEGAGDIITVSFDTEVKL